MPDDPNQGRLIRFLWAVPTVSAAFYGPRAQDQGSHQASLAGIIHGGC